MGVKDLFSGGKYISRKQMRENYRSDPTFQKKILDDPRMARILDSSKRQKKVHDLFMEKSRDGKVDVSDMNEIARTLEQGKVEGISSTKGHLIAKEFLPNSLRGDKTTKLGNVMSPQKNMISLPNSKPAKAPSSHFTYQTKPRSNVSDAEKSENRYTSFFSAMQSVRRNKPQH